MTYLTKQLRFFEENKQALLEEFGEKFIVVSSDLKVDAFASENDAYNFGCEHYGLGNFLLKDCHASSLDRVYVITPTIALA